MSEHIGVRIRRLRRARGMSQTALAQLADVTQPYISKIEKSEDFEPSRHTLIAIAGALRIGVAELRGEPGDPADPIRGLTDAAVQEIRAAILEVEEGVLRPLSAGAAETAAAIEHLDQLRADSDFVGMAPFVSQLLHDARHHGGVDFVRASYLAAVCVRNLNRRDLALYASKLSVQAAEEQGDLAWIGAARFAHAQAMPIEAAATTSRIADRTLAELQAGASDPRVRQMLGQIHLTTALACSAAGNHAGAAAHLAAAGREAASLGDPADGLGFNRCSFGPTNVALWQMTIDLEHGAYGRVIETAERTSPMVLAMANRRQSYWLTYGVALAHLRRREDAALAAFVHAEQAAPAAFAGNPVARSAVATLVHRAYARALPRGLRGMAQRVGVELMT